jgi:alpha-N-arabinofuranosidase
MTNTTLTIRADTPIGRISPRLYGHFAEHLGRCCYDGLWVGNQHTNIQQQNGFRADVLAALKALPVPMLRWPGGCYADHYHWRDGIGPAAERPIRLGMSCGLQVEDDNSLGTHEFLWLCDQIGAEPYLAGNVGSGTPQELCDWLEYCNTAVPTTLGRERAANGASAPFGAKLWGVGNENWGCGGNYDAPTYAREYVRYATMLRHVDPAAELVVCGQEDNWNAELLATIGRHLGLVDHLSIHRYWIHGGPETEFGEQDYYALLTEAHATETFVRRTAAIVRAAADRKTTPDVDLSEGESATEITIEMPRQGRRRLGIALDEWGVWHPEARPWGPHSELARDPVTYEQANTLRDALAAAIALEGFHRQCRVLTLANLAQIVNVLQAVVMTDGPRMWLTPTYHALRLHAPHIGATALPVTISQGGSLPDGSSAVSATASRTDDGLAVTLINRHYRQEASVRVECADAPGDATGQLLSADSPSAINSVDRPNAVAPVALSVSGDGPARWQVDLPPHSLATLVIKR